MESRSKLNRVKLSKDNADYVYYEKHHIVPRSLGGSNDPDNLILLTAREHFIAHLLLPKFLIGAHRKKMVRARWYLSNLSKYDNVINSRTFEKYRLEYSGIISGSNHHNYGKVLSEETKAKMSESRTGLKRSEETKAKMSKAAKRRRYSKETKAKMSESKQGKNHPLYGCKHSLETKAKMSESHKGENSYKFKGYYVTPFGKYVTRRDFDKHKGITSNWCINNQKLVNLLSFNRCPYLQSLGKNVIGKSFKQLGFYFDKV